jgi:hypothetical protein
VVLLHHRAAPSSSRLRKLHFIAVMSKTSLLC